MTLDQRQKHIIKCLKEDSGARGLCGSKRRKRSSSYQNMIMLMDIDEVESACFFPQTKKTKTQINKN